MIAVDRNTQKRYPKESLFVLGSMGLEEDYAAMEDERKSNEKW